MPFHIASQEYFLKSLYFSIDFLEAFPDYGFVNSYIYNGILTVFLYFARQWCQYTFGIADDPLFIGICSLSG